MNCSKRAPSFGIFRRCLRYAVFQSARNCDLHPVPHSMGPERASGPCGKLRAPASPAHGQGQGTLPDVRAGYASPPPLPAPDSCPVSSGRRGARGFSPLLSCPCHRSSSSTGIVSCTADEDPHASHRRLCQRYRPVAEIDPPRCRRYWYRITRYTAQPESAC